MSDIKTVTLNGGELKVEGLGGQHTVIVNRGSATLYASASANVTPDGDNTAAILAGGIMNLHDTYGTVYLLGSGKVQLIGTNTDELPMSTLIASGSGGSSGGGVSKEYVDGADAITLSSAKKYTDDEIAEIEGKIPVIPEALPADGGNAETAERLKSYQARHAAASNGKPFWVKFAESSFSVSSTTVIIKCLCRDVHAHKGLYPDHSDEFYGCYDILFRIANGRIERAEIQWEYLSSAVKLNDVVMAYYIDKNNIYHVACFVNLSVSWIGMVSTIVSSFNSHEFSLLDSDVGTEEIPAEYTTIIPSTIMPLKGISEELADLKGYIGYTDSDVYGLEADFENNRFTRLAGAVGKNPGADFDSMNAFGGRRRCAVADDGTVNSYFGEEDWSEPDGWNESLSQNEQCMVEQPKFYYKVVPLKTEKIVGADGYHLRKARYYISDTPKPGFKVHPAFVQNGIEIDKIYLSAYEGAIQDVSAITILLNDEQVADFDTDKMVSISGVKPASGTTQALTRANALKLAQNRGAGWGITTIQTLSATQLLFAIEYATFNSQAAIGNGVVNAAETIRTGSTSSLGNASGSVESGGVSYRGEENLWGNIFDFVDNVNLTLPSPNNTLSYYPVKISSSNSDILIISGVPTSYISSFSFSNDENDWVFIASELNGNSSLPVGAAIWPAGTGRRSFAIADGLLGLCGQCNIATHNGSFGARLIYIPQPAVTQEVTAND